jgi:hypothetical protein
MTERRESGDAGAAGGGVSSGFGGANGIGPSLLSLGENAFRRDGAAAIS